MHWIITKGNKGAFFTLNACQSDIDCGVEVVPEDARLTKQIPIYNMYVKLEHFFRYCKQYEGE